MDTLDGDEKRGLLMIEQAEALALAPVSLPVLTAHRVGIVDRG